MNRERRAAERIRVNMDVSWQAGDGQHSGTISDISTNGCFVLCSGEVEDGKAVAVEFKLARRAKAIGLRGEVVNHLAEIGFAMKFTGVGKTEANFLKKLISRAGSQPDNS